MADRAHSGLTFVQPYLFEPGPGKNKAMSSVDEKLFGKARSCPSSEELVLMAASQHIQDHLRNCEFCASELYLLSARPLPGPKYEPAEMPAHLRVLAESLLGKTTQ